MAEKLLNAGAALRKRLATPGKHRDGAGLFLQVARKGQASWTYQFRFAGATHWMSIGPVATFTLEQARKRHGHLRSMRDRGVDPRTVPHDISDLMALPSRTASAAFKGNAAQSEQRDVAPRDGSEKSAGLPFGRVVEMFLAEFAGGWTGGPEGKEAKAYQRTLTGHHFASLPVDRIETDDVEVVLKLWADKPATAEKVLMRIGKIMNYAGAKKLRDRNIPNPAGIKGTFEFLARPIVPETEHHPAMKSADVPGFMRELLADGSTEARALAVLILAGVRTDELRLAKWKEIADDTWTIPAERMKGKKKDRRQHSVPLAPFVSKLLGKRGAADEFIFPGRRYGARKPLWHSSLREVLSGLRGEIRSIEGLTVFVRHSGTGRRRTDILGTSPNAL
jgi:integrase